MESDRDLSPMKPLDPPPHYPAEYESTLELSDGSLVFVRPIVQADIARLAHAFEVGDIDTIRMRFFTGAPPTNHASLEYLANVNFTTRFALLAMDSDGTSIGIGRFEATSEPAIAEVAIVVAPEWRRRGLGRDLMLLLEPIALQAGYTGLEAMYLPENASVEALLEGIGYSERSLVDGIVHVEKAIP